MNNCICFQPRSASGESMGYFKNFATLVGALLVAANVHAKSAEDRGYEIAEMCDKASRGYKGEDATMKMEIATAAGDKVYRNLVMKKKEFTNDGERIHLLVESPPDVKGTKLLTWTHKVEDDEQWLYLPAMKRVRRISAHLKSGSFMGSEFAYEDFSQKEISKFKHKYLRDEKINGRDTWVVQRIIKGSDSGYSKELIWYDKEYKAPLKIEFYDRKKELLKVADFSNFKFFHKRWWRPNKIRMANVQTRNQSIIVWSERKLKLDLSASIFQSENMKE